MPLLQGKRVIVTGATAGIGKHIALLFAKEGASVAIFGTNKERADLVLQELESGKVDDAQEFVSVLVDVADTQAVEKEITSLLGKWPLIDVLVNNAGITKDGLLLRMKEEDWDRVIAVNLKSVYNTCHSLVRPMVKARGGKIINISSVVGLTGNAGQANYAASKAGVIGFTKALALELATRGICVNCIAPGFIQTPMTDALTEEQKEGIFKKIPMGRFGEPKEVAELALFLASSMSNYITGQVIAVDGGMVM